MALGGWDSNFDAACSWRWGDGIAVLMQHFHGVGGWEDWSWGAKGEKRLEDHEFGPCLAFFFFFLPNRMWMTMPMADADADVHIVAHSHILRFVVTF